MAKPRVFVSSTYYDLKHIRSSLETFIERLGYEPILSEKGDIAYAPDMALDESCYRKVKNADIFVLIVGGRYGAEKSDGKRDLPKNFYIRYDSITKQEYKSAVEKDIPIYILIEKSVYADFETYLRNKKNESVTYAHVDSVSIFQLIEEILSQPRNNPINYFDRYTDIEAWLREQWSGLFRELLSRTSSQQQLSSLSGQISELREVNKTLKAYLEQVVTKIAPKESARLIKSESKRLDKALQLQLLRGNPLGHHLASRGIPPEVQLEALLGANNVDEFFERLKAMGVNNERLAELLLKWREAVERDFKKMKLGLTNPEAFLEIDRTVERGSTDGTIQVPSGKAEERGEPVAKMVKPRGRRELREKAKATVRVSAVPD